MKQISELVGLEMVDKYSLTRGEVNVLLTFIKKGNFSNEGLATEQKKLKSNVYDLMQRLRLKKLLKFVDKDIKGNNIYGVNLSQFQQND